MNWNTKHIPDLKNKTAIVTGGNRGLGFQICLELANKNAHVIIACRSVKKGLEAVDKIKNKLQKNVSLEVIPLDLSDLNSVKSFATTFLKEHKTLNLLINNAGLVNLKEYKTTKTGIEMQMAVNHFGHFALTGYLFSTLIKTPNARVVTMSSGSYRYGKINFDDINWKKRSYNSSKAYASSKLANMLFMQQLQEKFKEHSSSTISVGAHPGLSATKRQQTIGIGGWLSKTLAQSVYKGALPALRAATGTNVNSKEYYGPKYLMFGYPKLENIKANALDKTTSEKLWTISEEITNVTFN